jgi:hypothetical protein
MFAIVVFLIVDLRVRGPQAPRGWGNREAP